MRPKKLFCALVMLSLVPIFGGPAGAGQTADKPAAQTLALSSAAKELRLTPGLAAGLVGAWGRSAVPSDLVAWELASGTMSAPREGRLLGTNAAGQPQSWTRLEANPEGWIENRALSGGTLYFAVDSERARVMIFEGSSFYVARINGEPRGGEKYGADWVRHPVRLRKGRNEFLIQCERGRFRGRLVEPAAPAFFTDADMTLPDLILGEKGPVVAGIRLVNATQERLDRIYISCRAAGQERGCYIAASVAPFMTQKLALPLAIDAPSVEGPVKVEIRATALGGKIKTPPFTIELKAVPPTAHHVRTFISEIDRSVQYFGVVPQLKTEGAAPAGKPALVLTLHGASVEGIGQARAYKPKDWAVIAAATNRRPYGFDWEDWGRLDAIEVKEEAERLFATDPERTYLTGHSMGGHGTWQIGATLPGFWAAIAPSAGWRSFTSYGGGTVYKNPSPVEKMLARAANPSDTEALSRNFLAHGVYVLHGDQDDNVPVTEARYMRELLGRFHADFAYYERPGAGHWWGNECVDWPPLFEFLRDHVRSADTDLPARRVEFVTANPGISSRLRWVEVLAQIHPLEFSRVTLERDEAGTSFKGTTENVLRLAIDVPRVPAGGKAVIEIDGTRLEAAPITGAARIFLERGEAVWRTAAAPRADLKGPRRSGGFKDAFRHGFVLVYGTKGDAAEDARAFGKARFDAEMFWVRGNSGVDVIPDTAFDPAKDKDRNVILYGNADTNSAWPKLLAGSPVVIRKGRVDAGAHKLTGADLAAYFIRPRPGSDVASVGVVAWTGPAGWMAASPVQHFISGAGFPDLLLISAEALRSGTEGIRAIGWFGNDWSLERGDIVWNDGARR